MGHSGGIVLNSGLWLTEARPEQSCEGHLGALGQWQGAVARGSEDEYKRRSVEA